MRSYNAEVDNYHALMSRERELRKLDEWTDAMHAEYIEVATGLSEVLPKLQEMTIEVFAVRKEINACILNTCIACGPIAWLHLFYLWRRYKLGIRD